MYICSQYNFFGFSERSDSDMLTRTFILLTILNVCYCEYCCTSFLYDRIVSDCGLCGENSCKIECNWLVHGFSDRCYWNYHSETCVRAGGILYFTRPKYLTIAFKKIRKSTVGIIVISTTVVAALALVGGEK